MLGQGEGACPAVADLAQRTAVDLVETLSDLATNATLEASREPPDRVASDARGMVRARERARSRSRRASEALAGPERAEPAWANRGRSAWPNCV